MNWREEKPTVATRKYKPVSSEKNLLTACSVILGFGRFIPLKFWDDWVLEDTDLAIVKLKSAEKAGVFMKEKMKKNGKGILRAIWKNIKGEVKQWGTL